MLEVLKYIFSSFWIWLGTMFLLWQLGFALAMPFYYIYKNWRFSREQFRKSEWLMTPYKNNNKKLDN